MTLPCQAGQIYKWVDAQGVTHFDAQPPKAWPAPPSPCRKNRKVRPVRHHPTSRAPSTKSWTTRPSNNSPGRKPSASVFAHRHGPAWRSCRTTRA
ncbi:DUF4124 domain-containing protein [Pseudomonas chlororaphis]